MLHVMLKVLARLLSNRLMDPHFPKSVQREHFMLQNLKNTSIPGLAACDEVHIYCITGNVE